MALDRPYHYGEEFTVAVEYHAKPRTGLHFIKPAPEDPTRPVQAWTFGQPRYHSYWFPCHDAPNDRATTEIIVTVPAHFQTIANGNLISVTDHGATKIHHWRHDIPHAAYLISLVVGEFAVIEDSYNGKPVNYYVRPDRKDDARYYMGKTPEMMRFFADYTGVDYPYDKYAQTVVEIYTGAMEHTTATTHSFALLLDERAALGNGQERHRCLGILSRPYRVLGGIAVTDRQAIAFAVLHLGDPADLGPDIATIEEPCFEIPGHHQG